jgi:hypothetical protein
MRWLRPWLRAVALAGGLGAAACAAPNQGSDYTDVQTGLAAFTPWRAAATRAATLPAIRHDPSAECVPFARAISGVDIVGDAHTWWHQAEGRFARGGRPVPGAVMAFRAQPDMKLGHVAVVTAVLDARTVLVAHRNWDGGLGKGRISLDQPVRDVSARGDWSTVRVWHEGSRTLGPNAWPLAGFIYNDASRRVLAGQVLAGL